MADRIRLHTEAKSSFEKSWTRAQRPFFVSATILIIFAVANVSVLAATFVFPPFLWDHFTFTYTYFQGHFDYSLPNIVFSWWKNLEGASDWAYRPTSAALYHLLFTLFGYEFSAFYASKWAIFFCTVWIYVDIARKLHASGWSLAFLISFLLFHPAHPVLMLFAPDLFVATMVGLVIRFVLLNGARDDGWNWSVLGTLGACVLTILAIGTKEVAFVFIGALVLGFYTLRCGQSLLLGRGISLSWADIIICIVTVLYCSFVIVTLTNVAQYRLQTSAITVSFSGLVLVRNLRNVFPNAPLLILPLLALVCAIWGLGWSARTLVKGLGLCGIRRDDLLLGNFLIAALLGCLFVSMGQTSSYERYVIPSAYLVGLWFAVTVDRLLPLRARPAMAILGLCVPLWNLAPIYAQALAYEEHGQEISAVLRQMSDDAAGGRQLVYKGPWPEWESNLRAIFSPDVAPSLGLVSASVNGGRDNNNERPQTIFFGLMDVGPLSDDEEIVTVDLARATLLRREFNIARKVSQWIGYGSRPRFDTGAPWLDATFGLVPIWRLALLRSKKQRDLEEPTSSVQEEVVHPCNLEPVNIRECASDKRYFSGITRLTHSIRIPADARLIEVRLEYKAGSIDVGLAQAGKGILSKQIPNSSSETSVVLPVPERADHSKEFELYLSAPTPNSYLVSKLSWKPLFGGVLQPASVKLIGPD